MSDYYPAAFSFADAAIRIAEGKEKIAAAEDDITIHTENLTDGGTPAVCAILAWYRCAASHNRRLHFPSVPPHLRKLIQVYQLEKTLPEIVATKSGE